jgi:hypothetical protein
MTGFDKLSRNSFFVHLKSIAYELKKYKKPPQTAAVSW